MQSLFCRRQSLNSVFLRPRSAQVYYTNLLWTYAYGYWYLRKDHFKRSLGWMTGGMHFQS